MTLGQRSAGRDNAFDVLRLAAAALVILSHGFALVGRPEPLIGDTTFGGLGVAIFFAISGFLVTKSWLLQPRLRPFVVKRALRLMPALIIVVLACAFVIGPVVTTLPLTQYLGSGATLDYVVRNVLLLTEYDLPGVFTATPHDGVNGSLWTLPIEVKAYALIAVVGVVGLLRPLLLPLAALVLVLAVAWSGIQDWDGLLGLLPRALRRASLSEVALQLIGVFCVGALLCLHRDRVPLRASLFWTCVAAWTASTLVGGAAQTAATVMLLPYAVLYAGHQAPGTVALLTRPGDVSYGLYLWGFPVQQCVVSITGPGLSPAAMVAIALPLTYVVALASWRLVEAPALRLKGRLALPLRVPDPDGHPDGPGFEVEPVRPDGRQGPQPAAAP